MLAASHGPVAAASLRPLEREDRSVATAAVRRGVPGSGGRARSRDARTGRGCRAGSEAKRPPGHGRRPKPDHLKRVDVVHDLTEAEKQALAGDGQLVPIGEEVTEQYEWQPSSLYIVRHIQKKYARQPQLLESGAAAHEKNIITAPKPPQPIPGGIAGPGLIAEVVTNRFVDHLPFHRQERRFGRHGCPFSRQTTDGWALDVAERWFAPLVEVMLEEVSGLRIR